MKTTSIEKVTKTRESKPEYVIHRAATRGHVNHGWLDSHHSFSFGSYYNPERMHFGVLRVLNDDVVQGGMGFGMHPHDNMEIISIPLEGDLEHRDSMGNSTVIRQGDIQVMSAGTGVRHSEFNKNADREVRFLQIWIYPHTRNVAPRYDQQRIDAGTDELRQVVSPQPGDEGVWIHQNAWFHIGNFTASRLVEYPLKSKQNGVYAFVIEGTARLEGELLGKRDGMGIWGKENLSIAVDPGTKLLLMEIPIKP